MKAKLLQSLRKDGKSITLEPGKITIVDLDSAEFTRLEAMAVVAAPTAEELLICGVPVEPVAEVVPDPATVVSGEIKDAPEEFFASTEPEPTEPVKAKRTKKAAEPAEIEEL